MITARSKQYKADIWLGLRVGYTEEVYEIQVVYDICQDFVAKGLCVTLSPTEFIYTAGNEPGCVIGLINYPRFPTTNEEVLADAVELAHILMRKLDQFRCSIITPEETLLLTNEEKRDYAGDR
jgi:hypothetical protein